MWPFNKKNESDEYVPVKHDYHVEKCSICKEVIKYPLYLSKGQRYDDLIEKGWILDAPTKKRNRPTFFFPISFCAVFGGFDWRGDVQLCPDCIGELKTFLNGKVDWVKTIARKRSNA